MKIMPRKKIYATTLVFELDVSYHFKGQHYKMNYLFDTAGELDLFAKECMEVFFKKNFQNIHISMYRKDKYSDTRISVDDVSKTVSGAKKDREKRIQDFSY